MARFNARPGGATRPRRHAVRSDRRVPVGLESLEGRLLPANIIWANAGDVPGQADFDSFNRTYGANATIARAIVRQAISDWDRVIVNFNYQNVGKSGYAPVANTFNIWLMIPV